MAGNRQQPLTVELEDGRLVISIGIDTLMVAAQGADDWEEDRWRITDPDAFADAIVRQLEHEDEDGTTPVHVAIDTAAIRALECGEPCVEEVEADADE